MRILVSASACEPGRGSEPGNGWQWCTELARRGNVVTVLTDPSGRHAIARALADQPVEDLEIIYVEYPRWARELSGWLGACIKYLVWQLEAFRAARCVVSRSSQQFDVVHHLTLGSIHLGTWMWALPVPLVIGPIGGGQTAPAKLKKYYTYGWLIERLRNFVTKWLMSFNFLIRPALRQARCVLVENEETAKMARRLGARRVEYLSATGIPDGRLASSPPVRTEQLRLLWVGTLSSRKGLPLAVDVVALARDAGANVTLTVAGDGPLRSRLEEWVSDRGLADVIEIVGWVAWSELKGMYENHDALLFTSLRDSSGAQLIEAMGFGVVPIVLNHQGAAIVVDSESGLKIPVGNAYQTLYAFVRAVVELSTDRQRLQTLSESALERARSFRWEVRVRRMSEVYRSATHSSA